jgi:hypothetical protein
VARFLGDRGQHAGQGIAHVGAIGGGCTRRDPEQALERHGVVDAYRASMMHAGPQILAEGLEIALDQRRRALRDQSPVLALRIEGIGRRANVNPSQHQVRIGPGHGTVGRHADGHVEVEPDAHARRPGAGLRRLDLGVGQPLQPG